MHYVYVLYGQKIERFYIGYTSNLRRRIGEHQKGKVHTTARYGNLRLLFYEAFLAELDARRREEYFKTSKGKKALRIMLRETLAVLP